MFPRTTGTHLSRVSFSTRLFSFAGGGRQREGESEAAAAAVPRFLPARRKECGKHGDWFI